MSVISSQYWPPEWLLTETDTSITGIGGISQSRKSMWTLKCFGPDGQIGRIRPYDLPTPLTIGWGPPHSVGSTNHSAAFSLVATVQASSLSLP